MTKKKLSGANSADALKTRAEQLLATVAEAMPGDNIKVLVAIADVD
jgi:hypothetical protein